MSEETKEHTSTQSQSSNRGVVPKHLSHPIQNPMTKRANGRNSYISKNTIKPNKSSELTKESTKNSKIINNSESIDKYFDSRIKTLKQNFINKSMNEDRESLSSGLLENNTDNKNTNIISEMAERNYRERKEKIIRAITVIKEDKEFLNFCKKNRETNEEARKICEITARYEKCKKDIGQRIDENNLKKISKDQLNYLSQAIDGIDSQLINKLVENSYTIS